MISCAALLTIAVLLSQQRDDAVALVRAVEAATADFSDFRAIVVVDRVDALTEESERRIGRVLLESSADSGRRFAIIFETFIGPDGRADQSRRHYIYDAGWLAEIDQERKQFVNRQIVAPGETFDPLRVGEGPLPLPIGQRADDVLSRFEVFGATPPTTGILRGLTDVRGVRLVPKPGMAEGEVSLSVDLFYDATTLLPRGVLERRRNGDRVEVLLREPTMNLGLDESDRALLLIHTPDPRDGWAVDVRPWKRRSEPMDKE